MRTRVVVGLVLLSVFSVPALAMEDLSGVMPEETAIYARAASPVVMLAELAKSELFTDGALLRRFFDLEIAELFPLLEAQTGVLGENWKELWGSIGGVHLALVSIGREEWDVDGVLALEISKPDLVRKILDELLGEESSFAGEVAGARVMAFEPEPEVTFYYAIRGNLLLVTTRPERITAVLTGLATPTEHSLGRQPLYQAAALRAGPETTFFAWAHGGRGFDLLRKMMGPWEIDEFEEAFRVMDLGGLHAASMASSRGITRARVLYDPDHMWLSALRGSPGPAALKAYVPERAAFLLLECGSVEKKVKALKSILYDSEKFPYAEDVEEALGEAEQMLGVGFVDLAEALGAEWAVFLPILEESGRVDDDAVTFAFEVGDPEKFAGIMAALMAGPLVKELTEKGEGLVREKYGAVEILHPAIEEDRTEMPCLAVSEDVLLLSGDILALKAALDAKASGRDLLSAAGSGAVGLPSTCTRLFVLPLMPILTDDSDFGPILDLLEPGAALVAAFAEVPGRIDLQVGCGVVEFIGLLLGGEMASQHYSGERNECLANLRAIGQAIELYRKEHGEDPPDLMALVKAELLPESRLVCPLDRDREVSCSYRHAFPYLLEGDWGIVAWCPHRLHKRLVLRRGGNAWATSEQRFLRQLLRQGLSPR